MPREATITYDSFKAAARDLLAKGERVTFAAARLKLGGGSYDVLRRYIDRFVEEGKGEPPQRPELTPAMQALQDELRAEALARVRDELAADAQALESERQALQLEQEQWQQRLVQAETEARLHRERLEELQREREELHARVDRERQRAQDIEQQVAGLQGALSAEREARTALTAQWVRERQELVDQFVANLEQANKRFEGLQQHPCRQVDEMRSKHVATVEALLREHVQIAGEKVASAATKALAGLPERLVDRADVDALLTYRLEEPAEQIGVVLDHLADLRKQLDQLAREAGPSGRRPKSGPGGPRGKTR